MSASVAFEPYTPQAFGVPCGSDVAFVFADDAERFRAMEYVGRRREP